MPLLLALQLLIAMASAQEPISENDNVSVFVAGMTEYPNNAQLAPYPGADEDCQKLGEVFTDQRVKTVTTMCGSEATRANIFNTWAQHVADLAADDQLIVYWIGYSFEVDGQTYLLPTDGTLGTEAADVSISVMEFINLARMSQPDVQITFIADTQRQVSYGERILGDSVIEAFDDNMRVLHPPRGDTDVTSPAITLTQTCLNESADWRPDDQIISARELAYCALQQSEATVMTANVWQDQPIWTLPAPVGLTRPKIGWRKPTQWGLIAGGGLALGAGTYTYFRASGLATQLEDPAGHFASEAAFEEGRKSYSTMRTLTYVLLPAGAVLSVSGTTLVVLTPRGVQVTGTF